MATNLTNIDPTLMYTQIWVETYGLKHGSNGPYYVNLFEYNEMIANISSLFEVYIDKAVFRCVHTSDTLRTFIELFLE